MHPNTKRYYRYLRRQLNYRPTTAYASTLMRFCKSADELYAKLNALKKMR